MGGADLLLEDITRRSSAFFSRLSALPVENRVESLMRNPELWEQLAQDVKSTRPVLSEEVWNLSEKFLQLKMMVGTAREKALYDGMSVADFVTRLLQKRPIVFTTRHDSTLLRDGSFKTRPFDDLVNDSAELALADYLSYDEISISALIGISSFSYFINDGNRDNLGKKARDETSYESRGLIIGLVGARFERPDTMESLHMIVSPLSTSRNGYGRIRDYNPILDLWAGFYGIDSFPSFDEVVASASMVPIAGGKYLNLDIFRKRISITIRTLLHEANDRAQALSRPAYIHMVGFGLGVWAVAKERQGPVIVDETRRILEVESFPHITALDFSWFPESCRELGGKSSGEVFESDIGNRVTVFFSRRNPADRLPSEFADSLLVVSFAWDGNSYAGNEYYQQQLAASGDPAAACMSTISEIQNPEINPEYVSSRNAFIAPRK